MYFYEILGLLTILYKNQLKQSNREFLLFLMEQNKQICSPKEKFFIDFGI